MDEKSSDAILATRSAGFAPEVNQRFPLRRGSKACKEGYPPCLWKPGQTWPGFQTRGYQWPIKRDVRTWGVYTPIQPPVHTPPRWMLGHTHTLSWCMLEYTSLWTEWLTDTCKNTTFSSRSVNTILLLPGYSEGWLTTWRLATHSIYCCFQVVRRVD